MISYHTAGKLRKNGFTEDEITILNNAKIVGGKYDGEAIPIDLNSEGWAQAMAEHQKVKDAFFKLYPNATDTDYQAFINDWRLRVGAENDAWIWIDQFYFRKQQGKVSKARMKAAYEAIQDLRAQVFID